MHLVRWCLSLVLVSTAGAAVADTRRVSDRSDFLTLVEGRTLTRLGVALTVSADGAISGRAFGREVAGRWTWRDGYFCREMSWGNQDLGGNCQMVTRTGDRLRFTSDRGAGPSADLTLTSPPS